MFRLLILLCALLVPTVALAVPGTLAAPILKEGQYVYTVPDGFRPDGIGLAGLESVQEAAKGLHFPFYVVIVDKLPDLTSEQRGEALARGYTERGDDLRAAYAIDKLPEDWAKVHSFYRTDVSSVFLLAYQPRKFRMLAGTRWKTELSLERTNLVPFHDIFKRAVTGTPKDPPTGIVGMMRKFDEEVFDRTDPERIRIRQEAAEKAAEEARKAAEEARIEAERQAAAAALAKAKADFFNTKQLAILLLKEGDKDYLPSDTKGLQAAIAKANSLPETDWDDTDKLKAATTSLLAAYNPVKNYYDQKSSEAAWSTAGNVFLCFILLAVLGWGWVLWRNRRRTYLELKQDFEEQHSRWSERVSNAAGKYVDTYGERSDIIGLDDTEGDTKKLWDAVAVEIDDIWLGVKGIEAHLDECKTLASKATVRNLLPLRQAISNLSGSFTFDTGKVNADELFGSQTKTITITPSEFGKSLENRFKSNRAAWASLKEAADLRGKTAIEMFPQTTLDRLLDEALKWGIPAEWYNDHPLAGNDNADQAVWKKTDDLRWKDPIAYGKALSALKAEEVKVVDRHNTLVDALKRVTEARVDSVGDLGSNPDPTDDPNITLSNAKDTEHRLQGILAASAQTKDTAAVIKAAHDVFQLYGRVKEQIGTIKAAIKDAGAAIAKAEEANPTALDKEADQRVAAAAKIHAKVDVARMDIKSGSSLAKQGQESLLAAKKALDEGRHMAAVRKADKALDAFKGATKAYKKAIHYCNDLDITKAEYEARVGKAASTRESYLDKLHRYGGRAHLAPFQAPQQTPIMDYGTALGVLQAHEAAWASEVQRARAESERAAEVARQAAEQARRAQRQAEEEAAEARRRSSYSSYSYGGSYSSRSSSSWGGGSSSSGSSSSWDSGGSSSSGSSWSDSGGSSSSGGDW